MTRLRVYGKTSVSKSGVWYKVKYKNKYYYLWQAAKGKQKLTTKKSSFTYKTSNKFQKAVVEKALYIYKHWDTVYGHFCGDLDSKGRHQFDCSGFVSYVLDQAMQQFIPVYDTSWNIETLYQTTDLVNSGFDSEFDAQIICQGKGSLDLSKLEPGDVVFFDEDPLNKNGLNMSHCGIYLGKGEFIQITKTWNSVCITPLTDKYKENFVSAIRFIPSENISGINKTVRVRPGVSCKVYKSMNTAAENVITTLSGGTKVTLLYMEHQTLDGTGAAKGYAYVSYVDQKSGGVKKGFIYKPYTRLCLD